MIKAAFQERNTDEVDQGERTKLRSNWLPRDTGFPRTTIVAGFGVGVDVDSFFFLSCLASDMESDMDGSSYTD